MFSINSSSYLKCDYCTLSLQRDFVHNLALQIVQKKKKMLLSCRDAPHDVFSCKVSTDHVTSSLVSLTLCLSETTSDTAN